MIPAELIELAKYAAALATGGAGVWWSQMAKAKAEGKTEGVGAAEHKAVLDRIQALETHHSELVKLVGECARKTDVATMERNLLAGMDSRFANLFALLGGRQA